MTGDKGTGVATNFVAWKIPNIRLSVLNLTTCTCMSQLNVLYKKRKILVIVCDISDAFEIAKAFLADLHLSGIVQFTC